MGIDPSVGSRGDSCDNVLAESTIGLFETEVIQRRGPCRGMDDVEFATLAWLAWYNAQRLLELLRRVPPGEVRRVVPRVPRASPDPRETRWTEAPTYPGR